MSSEWNSVEISSICSLIKRGISPKYSENVGLLVINQKCIRDQRLNLEKSRRNDLSAKQVSDEKYIRMGDVLINSTGVGTLGRVAQVKAILEPTTVDSHVTIVRPDPSLVDINYFGWAIRSKESFIESLGEGSTGQTELSRIRIGEVKIFLPPLKQQQAIADILSSLDDKIELNRQMCKTLEDIASALFKSWFIDFDPVKAKAEGRAPEGLSPEIADLFPDRFEDSAIGSIPKKWSVMPLTKVIEVNPKRHLKKGCSATYLDMSNMPIKSSRAKSWVIRNFTSGTRFQNGDTLLARITPCLENGKTCYVDFLKESEVGWGSTEYIILCPKPPLPLEYAYLLARTENFRSFSISNMSGSSGRQRVPSQCFEHFNIVLPSTIILEIFNSFVKTIFTKIKTVDEESHSLKNLRDTLLPNLISGKLKV